MTKQKKKEKKEIEKFEETLKAMYIAVYDHRRDTLLKGKLLQMGMSLTALSAHSKGFDCAEDIREISEKFGKALDDFESEANKLLERLKKISKITPKDEDRLREEARTNILSDAKIIEKVTKK